ncbi:MAG: substrate-binding domain-containing protein [Candidatus Pseudobacter hemicellulosilyticus]|uniref:Substrate-binding domain-containing protein n=1 Tax=Candidatus Pseudobacter hemicellulosilyticus TaxID=3121375 RepID=A0AAJ5WR86_9BACT|nr:MAG: substrate-binding domain-containing protein [Pseudobacter sp.]
MKRKVSLKDIATKANVSAAAVSYVLNGQEHRVSPEMAHRIKTLAQKLNYRPHHIARSLKTRRTNTIGLVVANISYRFTTGITSAIEAEAKKHNYSVLIGSSDEELPKFSDLVNVLVDRDVDGLILLPVDNSEKEIKELLKSDIPFILMDRYFPDISTSYIALDNYRAAQDHVDYLVRLGHTHIAFINYEVSMYHLCERTRGYTDAMKRNKLPVNSKWNKAIRREKFDEDMQKAISQICTQPAKKRAIIFASDTLAIKGIRYLNQLGKKIPEDISVISFDESEAFDLFSCAVTHGRQPLEEMGRMAVQMLINEMANEKVTRQVLLPSGFVKGSSCGEDR